MKASELTAGMGPEAIKEAYQLAEVENSSLRRCLLWAAQFVPEYRRSELATMIKEKVSITSEEEQVVADAHFYRAVDEVCTTFERCLGVGKMPRDIGHYLLLIRDINEKLPKKSKPSLGFFHEK